MELYQSYERELQDITKQIEDQLAELAKSCDTATPGYVQPPTQGPTSRQGRLTAAAELITRGKDCISSMEIEANDVIPAERINIRGKIVEQKKRMGKYDTDITQLRTKATKAEREDLLRAGKQRAAAALSTENGIPDDLDDESKKERGKMAAVTDKQKGNTDIVRNIERIATSSAATIKDAETNLYKQRETISNIHDTTREMDAEVSDARRVANQMHKMMVQNKMVMVGIIALLVIMIIVIIYVKAVGDGSGSSTVIVVLPTAVGGDGSGGIELEG
eukprot:GILI01014913.1.p1 GENE.GILI01014913.1~~GILI01014913.1.p1  ORF type:complete len:276 (-),score=67.74 GILI01014913.1:141-968(-)